VSILDRLRALAARGPGADAARVRAAAAAAKAMRHELRDTRRTLAGVAAELDRLRHDVLRLRGLQAEAAGAAVQLDRLADVVGSLDAAAHVRHAAAGATLVDAPEPHLGIAAVLPRALYELAVAAIPAPVFFDGPGQTTLRVPPRVASAHAIATWTYLSDLLETALVPVVVERFAMHLQRRMDLEAPAFAFDAAALPFTAGPARLVREAPGPAASDGDPALRAVTGAWLTVLLPLTPENGEAFEGGRRPAHTGATVAAADERAGPLDARPWANTALAILGGSTPHALRRSWSGEGGGVRYTWEVPIEPDRRLRAVLPPAGR
jgi:hypothetical protein